MTEYYNEEENANFHTLRYFVFYFALKKYHFRAFSSVEEGEIVAARYSDENSYYRYDCSLPLVLGISQNVSTRQTMKIFFLRARVISFHEDTYDVSRFH